LSDLSRFDSSTKEATGILNAAIIVVHWQRFLMMVMKDCYTLTGVLMPFTAEGALLAHPANHSHPWRPWHDEHSMPC